MPKTHYKLDRSHARGRTERDKAREAEEVERYGFLTWRELLIVPIEKIEPRKVWNPPRIEKIREAIAKGRALPAISVYPNKGRYSYTIDDGIHRYNASIEAGFTHIPVIVNHVEEREPPKKKERRTYQEGEFVKFKVPQEGRWEIGYLYERVFGEVFVVIAGDRKEAEWLGDFDTSYFDDEVYITNLDPKVRENIMSHWYMNMDKTSSVQRVASAYLEQKTTRPSLFKMIRVGKAPDKVHEYVEQHKQQGYPEPYAWALAWSRYCKFSNPGSDSCKQKTYLKNQGKGKKKE